MHVTDGSGPLVKVVQSMVTVQARPNIGDHMKKVLAAALVVIAASSASAATWWVGGVLYGNVCRAGVYYTVYPQHMAQPVGTSCPIRNNYGAIVGYGYVSNE